ncbi:MAG TPA: tetratricopeptide repeat protein, partial [Thermodesulfovibrionales bacterium]|nr:tetratricopeptide repeat protein [Thermodesulfovibrionales bacterium]
ILERYEQDYERERPGLVKEAMSLLWAARRGLSENELMELLGSDGQPLPHAYWSPPWLAVKESLVRRAGLLNFSHDYFRKAVSEKYIPEGNSQKAIHVQLADYFERHELTTRKVDELAWQLSNAEEWERLKICISDLQMFDALFTEEKKYELTYYWLKLGSGFDQVRAYSDAIASYEKTNPSELELAYIIRQVSQFHYLSAMYDDAEPLMHRTLNIYENHYGVNHPATAFSLNDLATLYDSKGNYNEAERLYKRAIEILEKNTESNYLDLAACLNNLALLKHNKGNYDNAEQYYERALEMYETILGPDDLYVALILSNISSVYISIIEVSAAGKSMRIPSVRKSLEELPEYVDPEEIASYAKVEPILKRSLAIREKTLGPNHTDLLSSFTNLSSVYIRMKRFDKAELLLRRALALCERTFGMQHPSTGATLYAFGDLYYSQEKFMEAVRYYSQAYDVLTKILGWKHPYAKYAFNKLALAQKLQKEQKIDQIFLFAHKVIKRLGLLPRD